MLLPRFSLVLAAVLWLASTACSLGQAPPPDSSKPPQPQDIGWPRTYTKSGVTAGESDNAWPRAVVYQPQVDSWDDYRDIALRSAVVVHFAQSEDPIYGVVEIRSRTVVDDVVRLVALTRMETSYRFPHADELTARKCSEFMSEIMPQHSAMEIALDRLLACIDAPETRQREAEASLDPPPIFYSSRAAMLIYFMGEPILKPIPGTSLQYVINCNWDIFFDEETSTFYLVYGDSWIQTNNLERGPWARSRQLPEALMDLPANAQWDDVRERVPGQYLEVLPTVFTSREPAEIILTDGEPVYAMIPGIRLRAVSNTESPLFRHSGDLNFYFLAAGRWFRAKNLEGPWTAATLDLPQEFKQIPRDSEWAYVVASVPGTDEAADAVMLASVPRRAQVSVTEASLTVSYEGHLPKFAPIPGTTIEGATNTNSAVFRCEGVYYCCENAVWFRADEAIGPWSVATAVPDAIYAIPPSYPAHNVTYAQIVAATDSMVDTQYTSGYDNALVTAGVLVLGAGVIAAVAAADDVQWNVRINLGGNTFTSYGSGAFYDSGSGFFCRSGRSYGPYAGSVAAGKLNAATGGWMRSAAAGRNFGGSGGVSGSVSVNSAFGTPLGGNNRFASWDRGVTSRNNERVAAARTSGASDFARTSGRSRDGDLYADRDGNVFKRDSAGKWQQREANAWKNPAGQVSALDREAMARGRGSAASARAMSGPSRGTRSGGGGGGGGRRGR